jgi:hypothetical protein
MLVKWLGPQWAYICLAALSGQRSLGLTGSFSYLLKPDVLTKIFLVFATISSIFMVFRKKALNEPNGSQI